METKASLEVVKTMKEEVVTTEVSETFVDVRLKLTITEASKMRALLWGIKPEDCPELYEMYFTLGNVLREHDEDFKDYAVYVNGAWLACNRLEFK